MLKSIVKPATVMITGARFDLMALNAWTLERQAMADSSRRTAVAARPIIKPQSLRPNGICVEAWARSIAMTKAYHKQVFWSAPAERSGDGALDEIDMVEPCYRDAAHSKLSNRIADDKKS